MTAGPAPTLWVGLAALRDNPLRTALSTLGVVIGVAALVAVLSVGDGVERFARAQLAGKTDVQAVVIASLTAREVDGVQVPVTAVRTFTPADRLGLEARLPPGTKLDLMIQGAGWLRSEDGASRGLSVIGRVGPRSSAPMVAGRPIDPEELSRADPVAVVNRPAARLITGRDEPAGALGQALAVGDTTLKVVGVSDGPAADQIFRMEVPFDLAGAVLTPSTEARQTTMIAFAPSLETVGLVKAGAEAWLSDADPAWSERISVRTNEARLEQARQGALIFKLLMGTVAGVSLLVGGIGIMNVLMAAVAERTREIGIRKAAGARQRDVLLQFLVESVTITGLGSAAGVGLGLALAAIATAVMRRVTSAPIHSSVSVSTVVVSVLAGVSVGLIFGIYPASRAARLDPIEAIRHE